MAVKKPRKTTVKRKTRNVQKNIGKGNFGSKTSKSIVSKGDGPNININIDQSKRSSKRNVGQAAPRQPQIISTFTPVQAPAPIYNFPLPTNLNPFESVVRDTQKGKIQEKPNELEKPKPKEKEEVNENPDVAVIPNEQPKQNQRTNHVAELKSRIYEQGLMGAEDLDALENIPNKEKKLRRKNKNQLQQPDLSESVWFNPSRETNTPLEEQAKQNKPTLLSLTQPIRERGSNIMTLQELNDPETNRRVRENLNAEAFFNAFRSGGQRLGGLFERLNRDEARRRRAEEAEKRARVAAEEQRLREEQEKVKRNKKNLPIAPEQSEEIPFAEEEQQNEGYKTEEMKKAEDDLEAYRKKISKSKINELKTDAKSKGIKFTRTTTKAQLYELLMDNYKKNN